MIVENDLDVENLKAVGAIVREVLVRMRASIRPGITTAELDHIAEKAFQELGANSAPKAVYDFPGFTCISVNNEAAHGIPSERILKEGDLVNIDVSAERNGYFADTGFSSPVGKVSSIANHLLETTQTALNRALYAARAGSRVNEVGKRVERFIRKEGLYVVENLSGHGVGRSIHESPRVENFYNPEVKDKFVKGQVVAIEPIISTNSNLAEEMADGWTLTVPEGGLVAQFEHSVIITDRAPIILT